VIHAAEKTSLGSFTVTVGSWRCSGPTDVKSTAAAYFEKTRHMDKPEVNGHETLLQEIKWAYLEAGEREICTLVMIKVNDKGRSWLIKVKQKSTSAL